MRHLYQRMYQHNLQSYLQSGLALRQWFVTRTLWFKRLLHGGYLGRMLGCLAFCFVVGLGMMLPAVPKASSDEVLSSVKEQVINRAYFFKQFRTKFHKGIKQEQVEGYDRLFNYWDDHEELVDLRWLAYALATAYHETGRKIEAIRECFCKTDACSIACVTKLHRRGRIKRNYAKIDPKTGRAYFGRGHVQLTHAYNYKRMGSILGLQTKLYTKPEKALNNAQSTEIMFTGMIKGIYTGKKLGDYFNKRTENWGGARRIINGLDHYKKIATYGRKFYAILRYQNRDPSTVNCMAPRAPFACISSLQKDILAKDVLAKTNSKKIASLSQELAALQLDVQTKTQRIATLEHELIEAKRKNATPPNTNDLDTIGVSSNGGADKNLVALKAENVRLLDEVKQLESNMTELIAGLEDEGGAEGALQKSLEVIADKRRLLMVDQRKFTKEKAAFTEQKIAWAVQQKELAQSIVSKAHHQASLEGGAKALAGEKQVLADERAQLELEKKSLKEKEIALIKRQELISETEEVLNQRLTRMAEDNQIILSSSTKLSQQSDIFEKRRNLLVQQEQQLALEKRQIEMLRLSMEKEQQKLHDQQRELAQQIEAFEAKLAAHEKAGNGWITSIKNKWNDYWRSSNE